MGALGMGLATMAMIMNAMTAKGPMIPSPSTADATVSMSKSLRIGKNRDVSPIRPTRPSSAVIGAPVLIASQVRIRDILHSDIARPLSGALRQPTVNCPIIPPSSCSRMWQWYMYGASAGAG